MKKRFINSVMLSALIVGALNSNIALATESEVLKGQVVKVSSNLNIRKSASTSSSVVGKMPSKAKFDILAKSGKWYKVKYGNITGYVSADYVKVIKSDSNEKGSSKPKDEISKSTKGQVINVSSNLNIRKSASTSSSVVGKMPVKTKFDILEKSGKWYKIKYGSITGFVSADYVKVLNVVQEEKPKEEKPKEDAPKEESKEKDKITTTQGQVINVSSNLNIRKSASTSSSVVGKMPVKAKFEIIEKTGTWYKVKYERITGFVSGDYVKVLTVVQEEKPKEEKPKEESKEDVTIINKGQVVNVNSNLNIRKSASTSSSVVGKMSPNAEFDIIEKSGNWYKIKYASITGYVSADYVKVLNVVQEEKPKEEAPTPVEESALENTYGKVSSASLNIRKASNDTSNVLGSIKKSQIIRLESKVGGWYKVYYNSGFGYINSKHIDVIDYDLNKPQSEEDYAIFQKVLEKAKTQVGSPYVYGGNGEVITKDLIARLRLSFPGQRYLIPEEYYDNDWRAFDCSGLMRWSFEGASINLGRSTSVQINNGIEIGLDFIKPGDLLFNKTLSHVGMYIGDGKWIESPSTGGFVRIVDVPWNSVIRARRVI